MKTDSYFEIGSTHDICQDYALSGKINDNLSYAIITDGCSESHKLCGELDFGSRVIAHLAKNALLKFKDCEKLTCHQTLNQELFFEYFGCVVKDVVVNSIDSVRKILGLHELYADATILFAISDGVRVFVYMFGDGGVITVKKDGEIEYNEISYSSSAPYYLSYLNDKGRNNSYRQFCGESPVLHSQYIIPFDGDMENIRSHTKIFSHNTSNESKVINEDVYKFSSFKFENIASVTVVSDGIKSFLENGKNIDAIKIVPQFVNFKNTNGCFVKRRLQFLKKENDKNNIVHYDDISSATIII